MANRIDGGNEEQGAVSGIDQELQTNRDRLHRVPKAKGRDDTLDEDLDRERLEPGLDAEGAGGAGTAAPGREGGNSNT
jgi:hypothetical protein